MEVHHHPNLHHKTKKFKEYFLEFLMIFLAVSLGFVAENLREHLSDRSKEKEYIKAFVRNLQDDTAQLKHVISVDSKQVNGIDSFLQLAHLPVRIDSNRKQFYYIAIKYFYNSATFKSNDATLLQLKSTGDYRLIEKDHVADSLSRYDAGNNNIYDQGNYYSDYFKDILSMFDEIMDLTAFNDTTLVNHNKFTGKPLPPLTGDSIKFRKLFNKVFDFRGITTGYIEFNMKPQLENATRLIAYLKNEYDIDE
ncbi:MAG TPA: hypothetical protein VHB70_06900 [Parafilimonas sp.]|nr:hypothetical protein [Parafilimonas sp.]